MYANDTKKGACLNALIAFGLTAVFIAAVAIFYDATYGVIDDPFITTVLNGAYTGTPDAHVVYIKYPLAWILMALYKTAPLVNWHFWLLEACFAVCLFITSYRICSYLQKIRNKLIVSALFFLLFWLCMAKMALTAHYSMCAAVLAGTGIFYFATIKDDVRTLNRILQYAAAFLMLWTAYALRARTLFMLLPIAGVLFLYKFFAKKPYFTFKNIVRWLCFPIILFIGLGGMELMHNAQYQSADWQYYLSFNDARTTLYDFYGLPPYEGNEELYQDLSISEERQLMYEKYYLELTDGVPADGLQQIADARVAQVAKDLPTGPRIIKTLEALWPNVTLKTYQPVNWICLILFVLMLLACVILKRWRTVWTLGLGLLATAIPWLWMIYMGKPTSRVTMGIWAADLLFFLALALGHTEEIRAWLGRNKKETQMSAKIVVAEPPSRVNKKKAAAVTGYVLAVLCGAALIFGIAQQYPNVMRTVNKSVESGTVRSALEQYCEAQPEYLYICESDVVNSLGFDVRQVDDSVQNLYWPGGWTAKMPLSREIWERYGIDDLEQAIAENTQVYLIAFSETDMTYWTAFYQENYPGITLRETDQKELEGVSFTIYQFSTKIGSKDF